MFTLKIGLPPLKIIDSLNQSNPNPIPTSQTAHTPDNAAQNDTFLFMKDLFSACITYILSPVKLYCITIKLTIDINTPIPNLTPISQTQETPASTRTHDT